MAIVPIVLGAFRPDLHPSTHLLGEDAVAQLLRGAHRRLIVSQFHP